MWQVAGHNRVVTLLEHSLKIEALAHAYLFVGPPHVGKMTLALNFSQAVNCESNEPPCGECSSCRRIMATKHADVSILGLPSEARPSSAKSGREVGINTIRELQHATNLPPYEGKQKVFIIDGVEYLTTEAANCLLKTLEEPPPRVYLLLLSSQEGMLLPTIVSRCQRLELRPLSLAEVQMVLTHQWQVDPERARLMARLSGGCLGWALSALRDDTVLRQRAERITKLLALAVANYEERFTHAAELAAQFDREWTAVGELLNFWLSWWHDLMLIKGGCDTAITNIDQEVMIRSWSANLSLTKIKDFIANLRAAQEQLSSNVNPRLVLEVLMLRMPQFKNYPPGGMGN